jgi:TrmH family RNA methyltransferase
MLTKKELNYYSSLLKKKYRSGEKKFLAEGKKIVEEGITNPFWIKNLEIIFATNEFFEKENNWVQIILYKKVNTSKIRIIKNSELKKLSDTLNPQGITAVFNMASAKPAASENELVCLENISDPGNVGTIIRNCDWFGIKEVILGEGCTDIYNPKTIRASAGSIFHLKFYNEANLIKFLLSLKSSNYMIITADLKGKNIYSFTRPEKFALIFSNEANGPSNEILGISDEIIAVPKKGNAESLNVSSASAVILSELLKSTN